jgi:threonine dehydrogenase-like Zn-dependent dehydrogenase
MAGPKPTALDDSSVKETVMRVAVMYAPGDVRIEERPDPKILAPTDAILRLPTSCICRSDLGPIERRRPGRQTDPDGS